MPFGQYKDLLRSRGFGSLLWTQLLGAFNDSVFKIVVTLLAITTESSGGSGGRDLALVGAVFILPFFLFSGYAGSLADSRNKRTVLIATKSIEIFSMLLAVWALWIGSFAFLLAVLFLMALQSTLFSPAKYGIVPEMVPDKDLSRANALIQMTTNLAIIFGTWIGSEMLAAWPDDSWRIGVLLAVIAVAGFAVSFGIGRVPEPAARKPFQLNPWSEIGQGVRTLYRDKPLWLTVLGISYFWMLGALLQLDIVLFTRDVLHAGPEWNGRLIAFMGLGIAVGSLAAGRLSGDKVELGLTPLGSIGMGLAGLGLATAGDSFLRSGLFMVLLGFAGGLFVVPLSSLLQQRSAAAERGRLIAANNFLNMFGVLAASAALYALNDLLAVGPDRIIFVFGIMTFVVTVYMLTVVPDFLIRFVLWMLTHTVYRIRIVGQENVPFRGPALLVSNHLSYIDGFLVGGCVQRFLRFLIYRPYYEMKAFHWILRRMHAIPIQGGDPVKVAESIELAREQLRQGHVVCIFAEGSVSRTGNMLRFKPGFERIMEGLAADGLDIPIVPVNLDRVWGSLFSMKDGKAFFRVPESLRYPITVSFGRPLTATANTVEVRQAVMELAAEAARHAYESGDSLQRRFIRIAKKRWFRRAVVHEHRSVSYGGLLSEAWLWGRRIRRLARDAGQTKPRIGIVLPPSIDAVLANLATVVAGGVSVNLPPDAAPAPALTSAVILDGLITDSGFGRPEVTPAGWTATVQELRSSAPGWKTTLLSLAAFPTPSGVLRVLVGGKSVASDAPAAIIFTAGSGGRRKPVVLSHANLIANVEALAQVFWVKRDDRVMGVLPFSRALGLTGTLWFPLLTGCGAAYASDPKDGPAVGRLARDAEVTIFVAAPDFYGRYLESIPREDLTTLRCALVGGDFLSGALADDFEEKFGVPLIEGYGLAEMTAAVALNIPDYIQGHRKQIGTKPGTVGHPLPGLAAKIIDPATGEIAAPDQPGMLWIKGPSRMLGYADDAAATQAIFDDGWLKTGDTAAIDGDGFLRIVAGER